MSDSQSSSGSLDARRDSTCYIERSKVREIVIGSNTDNETTVELLAEVDALPIFVAADFASSPTPQIAGGVREALEKAREYVAATPLAAGTPAYIRCCELLIEIDSALSPQAQAGETPLSFKGTDPADLWDEWLSETDAQYRTPQSAMAFAAAFYETKLADIDRSRAAAQASPDCGDDESRMEKISALIARLQSTLDRWGDTCVYIRRGGLSWGAVALNRRSDDEKHGVFDLQAQHDRDMLERLEQIERLKKDRDGWRQKVWDAEAKASSVSSTSRATPDSFDRAQGVMDATMCSPERESEA